MASGLASVVYHMLYGYSTAINVGQLDEQHLELLLSNDKPRVAWLVGRGDSPSGKKEGVADPWTVTPE